MLFFGTNRSVRQPSTAASRSVGVATVKPCLASSAASASRLAWGWDGSGGLPVEPSTQRS